MCDEQKRIKRYISRYLEKSHKQRHSNGSKLASLFEESCNKTSPNGKKKEKKTEDMANHHLIKITDADDPLPIELTSDRKRRHSSDCQLAKSCINSMTTNDNCSEKVRPSASMYSVCSPPDQRNSETLIHLKIEKPTALTPKDTFSGIKSMETVSTIGKRVLSKLPTNSKKNIIELQSPIKLSESSSELLIKKQKLSSLEDSLAQSTVAKPAAILSPNKFADLTTTETISTTSKRALSKSPRNSNKNIELKKTIKLSQSSSEPLSSLEEALAQSKVANATPILPTNEFADIKTIKKISTISKRVPTISNKNIVELQSPIKLSQSSSDSLIKKQEVLPFEECLAQLTLAKPKISMLTTKHFSELPKSPNRIIQFPLVIRNDPKIFNSYVLLKKLKLDENEPIEKIVKQVESNSIDLKVLNRSSTRKSILKTPARKQVTTQKQKSSTKKSVKFKEFNSDYLSNIIQNTQTNANESENCELEANENKKQNCDNASDKPLIENNSNDVLQIDQPSEITSVDPIINIDEKMEPSIISSPEKYISIKLEKSFKPISVSRPNIFEEPTMNVAPGKANPLKIETRRKSFGDFSISTSNIIDSFNPKLDTALEKGYPLILRTRRKSSGDLSASTSVIDNLAESAMLKKSNPIKLNKRHKSLGELSTGFTTKPINIRSKRPKRIYKKRKREKPLIHFRLDAPLPLYQKWRKMYGNHFFNSYVKLKIDPNIVALTGQIKDEEAEKTNAPLDIQEDNHIELDVVSQANDNSSFDKSDSLLMLAPDNINISTIDATNCEVNGCNTIPLEPIPTNHFSNTFDSQPTPPYESPSGGFPSMPLYESSTLRTDFEPTPPYEAPTSTIEIISNILLPPLPISSITQLISIASSLSIDKQQNSYEMDDIQSEELAEVQQDNITNMLDNESETQEEMNLCIDQNDSETNPLLSIPITTINGDVNYLNNSIYNSNTQIVSTERYYSSLFQTNEIPTGLVRTKASLKQIDDPINYNFTDNTIASKFIRNENPLLSNGINHDMDENSSDICERPHSSTIMTQPLEIANETSPSLLADTKSTTHIGKNSVLNISFSTPSKRNNSEEEDLLMNDLDNLSENYIGQTEEEIEKIRIDYIDNL